MWKKGWFRHQLKSGRYLDAVTRPVKRFFRWIVRLRWSDPKSLLVAIENSHGRSGSPFNSVVMANTGESLMKPVQAMRDLFASDEVAEGNTTERARIFESRISRPIHISGYGREVHDFYATPDWVTEALLRHVQFRGRVWEPCCGSGAITTVLQRNGYDVTSTDITDHGFGTPGIDFLSRQVVPDGCRAIVTNPPYGGNGQSRKTQEKSAIAMLRFVDHALRLTETMQGQLALLVRFQWVAGQRAAALISAGPFAAVIALTHRIQWFDRGEATNISQHHHAWIVFDHAHPADQPPSLLFSGCVT